MFLASEKINGTSMWQPYLDVLPKKEGITLMFTEDEIDLLKGSQVCIYLYTNTHEV